MINYADLLDFIESTDIRRTLSCILLVLGLGLGLVLVLLVVICYFMDFLLGFGLLLLGCNYLSGALLILLVLVAFILLLLLNIVLRKLEAD